MIVSTSNNSQFAPDDDFIDSLPNHFKRIPDDVESYVYNMGDDIAQDNIAKLFVRTENKKAFKEAISESDDDLAPIQIYEDNVLKIKEEGQNIVSRDEGEEANKVDIDNFSVSHGSFFYDHFIINNIAYQSSQKVQIVQTFSDDFLYSFGENPVQATFSGILLNTDNHRWRDHWLYMYDELLNAHDSIKNNIQVYIMFEEIVWKGRILDTSFSEKARRSRGINFNFTFYIQDKITRKEKPPHETHNAQVKEGGGQRLKNRVSDFKNVDIKTTDFDAIETSIRDQTTSPDNISKRAKEEEESELKKAVRSGNPDRVLEEISKREENGNTDNIKDDMADVINKQGNDGDGLRESINNAFDSAANGYLDKVVNMVEIAMDALVEASEGSKYSIKLDNKRPFVSVSSKPEKGFEGSDLNSSLSSGGVSMNIEGDDDYKSYLTNFSSFISDKELKPPNAKDVTLAGIYAAKSNNWLDNSFDPTSINLKGTVNDYIYGDSYEPGVTVNFLSNSPIKEKKENDLLNKIKRKINNEIGFGKYSDTSVGDRLEITSHTINTKLYPSSIEIIEGEGNSIVNEVGIDTSRGNDNSPKIEQDWVGTSEIDIKFNANYPKWPHQLNINANDKNYGGFIQITACFYKAYVGGEFNGTITSDISKVRSQVKAVTNERLNAEPDGEYKLEFDVLNNWFNGEYA